MKVVTTALAGAMIFCAYGVDAQSAPPAAMAAPAPTQPAMVLAPAAETPMLRIGTKVPLKLSEELTTKGKRLRIGQHFQMETTEPVMVNGMVVIPAGSPATGEVTDARNNGMWGKSGHLAAQMQYVTVGGRQVRMTGTFDNKGTAGGIGAVAASAIVFAPAGFFIKGTSAHIPMGAPLIGFIGEDVPLSMAAAPSPIVIQPAAVAPASPPPPMSMAEQLYREGQAAKATPNATSPTAVSASANPAK